jgi:hypothetical protein
MDSMKLTVLNRETQRKTAGLHATPPSCNSLSAALHTMTDTGDTTMLIRDEVRGVID